jgi:succinate dehydrogenase / fumarate reductase cytochrome b subunit
MARQPRPLSPHLQVYRPQITSVLSITHRISGVALGAGALLLTWWLVAAVEGPESFNEVQAVIGSWYGRLLIFGFTLAFFFHLSNGVRHLFWDLGYGLELRSVYRSGWVVMVLTLVLTLFSWLLGYAIR